jgi:hypothetical protein
MNFDRFFYANDVLTSLTGPSSGTSEILRLGDFGFDFVRLL